jgi:PAS domain S-box-containing protein
MINFYLVLVINIFSIISCGLLHKGYLRKASILTVLVLTTGASFSAYVGDGIHDVSMIVFPAIIIISSLLFENKLFVFFSALPIFTSGIITLNRYLNNYPEVHGDEQLVEFTVHSLILIITAIVIRKITMYELQNLKRAKKNESKYRNIFENVQDVFYELDLDGKILEISPSVEKFLKYKRENIIGKNIADFFADSTEKDHILNKILEHGKITDTEISLLNKESNTTYSSLNATLLKNGNGNQNKIVGSMRDITERKTLEAQLRQAQKMEAVGTLAGGIAHDFNNLLTVINGYSDFILMKLKQHEPYYKELSTIRSAGKKATILTRQILAFSRKQIVQPKNISINEVISDLNKMMHSLIGEDINTKVNLYPDIPIIKADPGQIEQIMINLFVNARDALNERKETNFKKQIIIETGQVYLDKQYVANHLGSAEGACAMIAISDNGVGMDKDKLNKIFEPFYTTKDQGKGTGLGLSMVYGIIKQNQANIYVYSEPSIGTTIKIYWPLVDTDAEKVIKEKEIEKPKRGNEIILVVEDNDSVREFTCKSLSNLGYSVFAASSGEEAFKILYEHSMHPDLLITDMVMPGINGKELSDKIKEIFPEIPTIITSGYTQKHNIHKGLFEKEANFIQKPFSTIDLSSKVRDVLDRRI